LLFSPFNFPEFSFGYAEPLGLISLITWEQSSLKCIRGDKDFSEPLEGEEGETMDFPFSRSWCASIFNPFLAWEDFTGEWGEDWTIYLLGEGVGKDKLGQPLCWETTGWTFSCHPSFLGTFGCNEM
jgi:hypothetical protein